jgi:hypothetical protein
MRSGFIITSERAKQDRCLQGDLNGLSHPRALGPCQKMHHVPFAISALTDPMIADLIGCKSASDHSTIKNLKRPWKKPEYLHADFDSMAHAIEYVSNNPVKIVIVLFSSTISIVLFIFWISASARRGHGQRGDGSIEAAALHRAQRQRIWSKRNAHASKSWEVWLHSHTPPR